MTKIIEIVPYRDEWADDYQALARKLRDVIPSGSQLHHIGSTAIKDMAAKDVIDIQLSVPRLTDVQSEKLEGVGFNYVADRRDHQPPGSALPDAELAKLFFRSDRRPAHLHVREHGRFNQRYAILCRDFLRAEPQAAAAYEKIKVELACRFSSEKSSYYAIKDPVFDIIMSGANLWAETQNWDITLSD